MSQRLDQSPIRLLVIDDHTLFREALARLLQSEPGLEVTGQCGAIEEALQVIAETTIDVVLLDLNLEAERGDDFFQRAREKGFAGRCLLMTGFLDEPRITRLLQQGASGVFAKNRSPELLIESIRDVARGQNWLDQNYVNALLRSHDNNPMPAEKHSLSGREQEVLQSVCEGLSNKEIAAMLNTSESAVKSVLQRIFQKTGVRTRSKLLRIALEPLPAPGCIRAHAGARVEMQPASVPGAVAPAMTD